MTKGSIMTKNHEPSTQLRRGVALENLDPGDKFLAPGIMPEHMARYDFAVEWLKNHPMGGPLNVVDAASGRGYGADRLKSLLPSDTTVVGVELGADYTKRAAEKYNPNNTTTPGFLYVQGDVRHIPVPSGSTHMLTAYEITEHLPKDDQQKFLDEIFRILRPGGYGLISIPYRYSFEENKNGEVVRIDSYTSNTHHLYEPTAQEMETMIEKAGLVREGTYGQVIVSPQRMDMLKKINKFIPAIAFYAWVLPQDSSVQPLDEGKVALTQVFAVQKPHAL
jgi:ubiquinone/menaquinone biosynthesis C-methylase UbiE